MTKIDAQKTWTKADQYLDAVKLCAAAAGQPVEICRVNDADLGILVKDESAKSATVSEEADGFLDRLAKAAPDGYSVLVEDHIGNPNARVLLVADVYTPGQPTYRPEPVLPEFDLTKTADPVTKELARLMASEGKCTVKE
jgi:hypothetical protein